MSEDVPWPPVSPRAALLSSPSGRKKYEAYQNSHLYSYSHSPVKRSATTPNLLDQLRAARKDKEFASPEKTMGDGLELEDEDEEEDEETLQLKLAAIEAKLKLKKLQQNKAKAAGATPAAKEFSLQEPLLEAAKVEVAVSPTRRPQPAVQQRSPSRVLLGIDKGVRGGDVSLRRANTTATAGATRPRAELGSTSSSRPSSRSSAFGSARSTGTSKSTISEGISNTTTNSRKTFSERMAQARERVKTLEQQRETTSRNRSKGFGLDQAELEKYKIAAAEESRSRKRPMSPPSMHQRAAKAYSRDDILNSAKEAKSGTRPAEKTDARPSGGIRASPSRPSSRDSDTVVLPPQADASLFEGFSQLHLSSRILPHSFLKRALPSDKFTVYRVPDLLREVKSPEFELPASVCDYVICGVIASKSGAMDQKVPAGNTSTVGTGDWERQWDDGSKNQRRFMVLTLTDLKWTVDLYLFGTALPRYHRLTPGTVVAILNPGIMPPKPGKADTGAFSLTLHDGDDTVLEIGTARDLGHCKTIKKDGKECGSWVDSSKTEICEWHLNAELNKTRATRMGVNTGTNGFGGTGAGGGAGANNGRRFFDKTTSSSNAGRNNDNTKNGLLPRDGHRYDKFTGSHFYISRSNPGTRQTGGGGGGHGGGLGAGSGFGLDDDDPFISQAQLDRDRNARLRKHFATQEKEREIAEKLGSGSYAGFGGAGAEYLRQKTKSGTGGGGGGGSSKDQSDGHPRKLNREVTHRPARTIGHDDDDADDDEVKGTMARFGAATGTGTTAGTGPGGGGGIIISRKRTAADVRLSPVKVKVKKTRFVTPRGIREAGRESLGVGVAQVDGNGSDDDDLEIV